MLKPIKSILILTTIILLLSSVAVSAATSLDLTSKLSGVGSAGGFGTSASLGQSIGQIVRAVLSLIGVIFMVYIVYAGYLWMTAQGKEEQIEKAKTILRGSIIGLIIVLGAYLITAFVVSNVMTATQYSG
jgi:amino acid transporter